MAVHGASPPARALTDVADSGVETVVFTPDDTVSYNTATTSVRVTISPAASTGAPGYAPVSAAGKTLADAALDKKNLRFCAYDRKTNTYFPIAAPDYRVDSAGYLYFYTERGGGIVISSSELTKK